MGDSVSLVQAIDIEIVSNKRCRGPIKSYLFDSATILHATPATNTKRIFDIENEVGGRHI